MRYIGQSYELKVAVPQRALEQADAALLNQRFYQQHERGLRILPRQTNRLKL